MKIINRKMLVAELERGIMSYRFFICFLGAAIMVVLSSWDMFFLTEEMKETGLSAGYHLSIVLHALKSEAAVFVIPVLSTLPLSGSFLEEYKSRFCQLHIIRCDRKSYVISKVFTTGISSGLGIFLGVSIIIGLLYLVFSPMELQNFEDANKLFLNLFQYSVITALMGSIWGSLGALLGICYRNAYMAYGGPFLINYLLIIIFTRYVPDIYVLNPREWLLQEHYKADNPLGIIILLLEICTMIQLLEGIAIWKKVRQP